MSGAACYVLINSIEINDILKFKDLGLEALILREMSVENVFLWSGYNRWIHFVSKIGEMK